MHVTQFKLAVLSIDDFSDINIERLFLNMEVTSENDIREAVGVISTHRPELLKNIASKHLSLSAA